MITSNTHKVQCKVSVWTELVHAHAEYRARELYLHTARVASAHGENNLPRLSVAADSSLLNQHGQILTIT